MTFSLSRYILVLYNGLCHDRDRTPRDATLSVPAGILSVRLTLLGGETLQAYLQN